MSKYQRDVAFAEASEVQREQAVFRYQARYGQHPETEAKYRDAILACKSIDNLSLTITEIARMYGLKPEPFRNQLKRHFPDVLVNRRELRAKLGFKENGNIGLKQKTVQRYAHAIELLRDPAITVREAASRTEVSYQGLQQHLIFYHKDIADARMLVRSDALMKPLVVGDFTAKGGIRVPRPDVAERYAPAVEMYRTTDLPVTEIAERCDIAEHNLRNYLARWHRPLMEQRRERVKRQREEKRLTPKVNRSRSAQARIKYMPAIELITAGKTIAEAARTLGVPVYDLSAWLKLHEPGVLEVAQAGMMRLPSGKLVSRKTYNKYLPISEYINSHPSKPTKDVAEKWHVPVSSLIKKMYFYFPEIWERHKRECAKKMRRMSKGVKGE